MTTASFTGEYPQRIDGKGRMSIPADFRRALEKGDPEWTEGLPVRMRLLYGANLKDRLEALTISAFDAIVAEFEAKRTSSQEEAELLRALKSIVVSQSVLLELDRDGRVVIPSRQREKLGLTEGEVMFAGMVDRFEIWAAPTYDAKVGVRNRNLLAGQPEDFDAMALLRSLGA